MFGLYAFALAVISAVGCLVIAGARRRSLRIQEIVGLLFCAAVLAVLLMGALRLEPPNPETQTTALTPTDGHEPVSAVTEPPIPRQ